MTWAHDLKLGRARRHLKQIEAEVERWMSEDGYRTSVHPDPEPPRYVIRAEAIREPGEDLALLVGDCLQNARAALDYVAYALGNAGARGQMSEAQARRSGFPIVGDVDAEGFLGRGPDLFEQRAARTLATVSPEARQAMKDLQPFNDGDIWDYNGLWVLNELARLDRHRFLHFGAVHGYGLELDRRRVENVKMEGRVECFEGTVYPEIESTVDLGRVTIHPDDPSRPMKMGFTEGLALTFAAEEAGLESIEGKRVDMVIWDCVSTVAGALRTLTPFLADD